jgi:hypothetical protein
MRRLELVHKSALFAALCAVCASAQDTPNAAASKYPLRLHVLAVDDTHRNARLQPNWCSTSIPDMGSASADSGGQGSPCGGGSGPVYLGGTDDDFAGAGRADLVTPPAATQALSFTYEGCGRMRVPPGFQSLQARWKKRGKLEVLIPSDAIVGSERDLPIQKCTLTVALQEFVYLRMRNGSLIKISQDAYYQKPSLRRFLSGGAETLRYRVPATVSVKQLMPAAPPPPSSDR